MNLYGMMSWTCIPSDNWLNPVEPLARLIRRYRTCRSILSTDIHSRYCALQQPNKSRKVHRKIYFSSHHIGNKCNEREAIYINMCHQKNDLVSRLYSFGKKHEFLEAMELEIRWIILCYIFCDYANATDCSLASTVALPRVWWCRRPCS